MPPRSPSSADVAEWLRSDVLASFVNDSDPHLWPANTGFFALAMLSLARSNALAGLVSGTGRAGTVDTFTFIAAHYGAAGAASAARYAIRAAPLYALFRHGLIHQREPGALLLNDANGDARELHWELRRGRQRATHLQLASLGRPGAQLLSVDVDCLFDDTVDVHARIIARTETEPAFAATIARAADEVVAPRCPEPRHIPRIVAGLAPET